MHANLLVRIVWVAFSTSGNYQKGLSAFIYTAIGVPVTLFCYNF